MPKRHGNFGTKGSCEGIALSLREVNFMSDAGASHEARFWDETDITMYSVDVCF